MWYRTQIFVLLFSNELILTKNGLSYILGDFSQTPMVIQLVTLSWQGATGLPVGLY
jgi:hypothetical protein